MGCTILIKKGFGAIILEGKKAEYKFVIWAKQIGLEKNWYAPLIFFLYSLIFLFLIQF